MAPSPSSPTPRARRTLRWLLRAAALLLAWLLLCAGGAWWWAGSDGSLARTLALAAHLLPEGQSLHSRDVSGSLRTGGRIGQLRWQSAELAVEVEGVDIAWRLAPLLERRLQVDRLHAERVRLTPLGERDDAPPTAPAALTLPLRVELASIAAGELVWNAPNPLAAHALQASYRYDGAQHRLTLAQLRWAEGHYHAELSLQGAAPMALSARVQGALRTPLPGRAAQALDVTAQALIEGPLAGADARLQLHAQLRSQLAQQASDAVHADLRAELAPWAAQPLRSAEGTFRGLDLAALWPQAPATQLAGRLQAGPSDAGWALQLHATNALAGPWDKRRLPLSQLDARAHFDGQRWQLQQADARLGDGRIELQGHLDPQLAGVEGLARVYRLRPADLYSTLAPAPLSGELSAQRKGSKGGTGDAVQFSARLQRTGTSAPSHPLSLDLLVAEGRWQGQQLQLARLQLQALQAQLDASALAIDWGAHSASGTLTLAVPGARLELQGRLAARSGEGRVQLQLTEPQRLLPWLERLPGASLHWPDARLQGQARLDAHWQGGWHSLRQQLQQAGLVAADQPARAPPGDGAEFTLQARLSAARLALAGTSFELRDIDLQLSGSAAQAQAQLAGELRSAGRQWRLDTQAHSLQRAPTAPWQLQIDRLRAEMRDTAQPKPWSLQLRQALALTARHHAGQGWSVEVAPGEAALGSPLPGQAQLRWQAAQWSTGAPLRAQTQGALHGLPLAWVDALQPGLLAGLGLAGDLSLDGAWSLRADDQGLSASAHLQRAGGDLRLLALAGEQAITLRSSGQGQGAGRPMLDAPAGAPAGLREARVEVSVQAGELRAALRWDSARAGRLQAQGRTRLTRAPDQAQGLALHWAADAPIDASVRAQLPEIGLWATLAPPGWRVQGTLAADLALSGTRADPRWHGSLLAERMALRSVLDGVDLRDGSLRATLEGKVLRIDQFRIAGGSGSGARILGRSGNRSSAPKDGGELNASGELRWSAGADGAPEISMQLQAQARRLQLQVRADRQLSVSGPLTLRLAQGRLSLGGELVADRATLVLPSSGAPTPGADVVVRGQAAPGGSAPSDAPSRGPLRLAQPPDVAIRFDLGPDFALQGQGITTRLVGALDLRSSAATGGQPRVTGEVRTDEGRYRAWGQALDVEAGLLRWNGPYDNPQLDILALRPHIPVRAGVRVTGSASAPRVRLYAEPDLPDAEKLSWVVLGRSPSGAGAEAALLQQAALALLGGPQDSSAGIAQRLGLDEIGLKGPQQGEDAGAAALTLGKRLSQELYVTYEYSLSGTLGTLYLFYDLTRSLTLRGQTGAVNALDLVYTVHYD